MGAYARKQFEPAESSGNGKAPGHVAVDLAVLGRSTQSPAVDHPGYLLVFSDGSAQWLLWFAGESRTPPEAPSTHRNGRAVVPAVDEGQRPLIDDPEVLHRWRQVQTAGTWLGFVVLIGLAIASRA
jgi:hypothetical protein